MKKKRCNVNWPKLASMILICELAGIIGSIFAMPSISGWFSGLIRPIFTPPNWVFAPVWIVLYALMGIALYLVIEHKKRDEKIMAGLLAFGVQLVLNVLWSAVFFGMHDTLFALFIISVLWVSIALTIYWFSTINKKAAYLMAPYLFWVSFALVLNYAVWILNA